MNNSEKLQILKNSIISIIQNTMTVDEIYLFNFAKQQAKEMRIEISKGEIKSIICNILATTSFSFHDNINTFDVKDDTAETQNENYI